MPCRSPLLMLQKYANHLLVLGIIGSIAGSIGYFHFFGDGNSPSHATAGEPSVAALLTAGAPASKTTARAANGMPAAASDGLSGVRVQDAGTVFDFNVTPEWIVARWPAVSTGLAQLPLEGYRVPLVTGTAQHDLAGCLTYYFDPRQKLQQITFVGTTGDPRPLIGLLTTRFQFGRRLANDPGLVIYEAGQLNGQPASVLRIRLASADDSSGPYRSYNVELSLRRME